MSRNRTGADRPRGRAPTLPQTPFVRAAGSLAPDARNPPAARRTPPVRAHPLLLDRVPEALDEQVAAIGTIGVLPTADPAGEVACVDQVGTGRSPGLACN